MSSCPVHECHYDNDDSCHWLWQAHARYKTNNSQWTIIDGNVQWHKIVLRMSLIVLTDSHLLPPGDVTLLTLTPLSSIVKIIKISSITSWSTRAVICWMKTGVFIMTSCLSWSLASNHLCRHHAATVTTYQTLFLTFGICKRSPESIITSSAQR